MDEIIHRLEVHINLLKVNRDANDTDTFKSILADMLDDVDQMMGIDLDS